MRLNLLILLFVTIVFSGCLTPQTPEVPACASIRFILDLAAPPAIRAIKASRTISLFHCFHYSLLLILTGKNVN